MGRGLQGLWGALLAIAATFSSLPGSATAPGAFLAGTVAAAPGEALPGRGIVRAVDVASRQIYTSEPISEQGEFEFRDLPGGQYDLAIHFERGLFLVPRPVVLSGGQRQRINLLVHADARAETSADGSHSAKVSFWNNPLITGLTILGSAAIVGVLVDNAVDDEPDASDF